MHIAFIERIALSVELNPEREEIGLQSLKAAPRRLSSSITETKIQSRFQLSRAVAPPWLAVAVVAGSFALIPAAAGAGQAEGAGADGLRVVLDRGEIVIALDRAAAPDSVLAILKLTEPAPRPDGETAGYYDGLTLDHTWPHIELGTGVRSDQPVTIPQEISAESLGLHREHITRGSEAMNLWQFEFAEANERWKARGNRPEIFETWLEIFEQTGSVDFLTAVSRKEINEVLGYRYVRGRESLRARRGSVYLKPKSTVENSPALRILLADRPQLDGRVTVIGRVVSGLELAHELSLCDLKTFRNRPVYQPVDPVVIRRLEAVDLADAIADADSSGDVDQPDGGPEQSRSETRTETDNQPHDAAEPEGGSP